MPPPATSPSRSRGPTVVVSVKLSPAVQGFDVPLERESGRGAAQARGVGSQGVHEASQIVGRALVDHVDVQGQPRGSVHGGGGAADEDVGDVLLVQDAEKSGEVGHGARCRAARPARCSSSANRWSSINWRSRSSTLSFRFSRSRVRSMSFL